MLESQQKVRNTWKCYKLLHSDINKSKKMDIKYLHYLVCRDYSTKVEIYIHYYLVVTSTLLSGYDFHGIIIVNNFHTGISHIT